MRQLVPLGPSGAEGGPGDGGVATGVTPFATPPLAWPSAGGVAEGPNSAEVGFKAARLGGALRAGLPVLPGWVVPVSEGRRAMAAGAEAIRAGGLAAGRVAVLGLVLDDGLAAELRTAVDLLGGRVIVRSSSPLEADARWSGAFSSIAEVGPGDIVSALRSCWASAFAVDPLERLEECGLPPEALELGALIQPEIHPTAGGVARVTGGGARVTVEGVRGHPGALLSGWAEGASAEAALPPGPAVPAADGAIPRRPGTGRPGTGRPGTGRPGRDELTDLLGQEMVGAVAALAGQVLRILGDDTIEWAADGDGIWLLQSMRSGGTSAAAPEASRPLASRDGMPPVAVRQGAPRLAAEVMSRGAHVPGRPGAPGMAAGRLVACRPHERPAGDTADAILLVDRPVPALAPLLFGACGVIARSGAAGSHLAGVARSLGVPMVIGCRPEPVTGPPPVPNGRWLAAIDGTTGDVALLPAGQAG